ncbi:hypothetical protein RFI_36914 [Reticulomyxa filosa]|uniref:Uncharacterized protein n=1 Tax=Reticulomyxa filosa TaxID=46433 RepID=X6LGN2_RETFI|nr:hypothetical protein RFI_36914 [Reticulomyxa filosa]|eukprot:ETO00526.1 hypothetical protein RFI_36914 [Reticulomyxa filosa]
MGLLISSIKMEFYCNNEDIAYPYSNNNAFQHLKNENSCNGHYTVLFFIKQHDQELKLILQHNLHIDINNLFNEYRQTPLHLAINNKHWNAARYYIEKGAWIEVRERMLSYASILKTPF